MSNPGVKAQIIAPSSAAGHRRKRVLALLCSAVGLTAAAIICHVPAGFTSGQEAPATLSELLELPSSRLTHVALEHLNLLCAQDLSPTNEPDVISCAATVKSWAEQVRSETERHQYRYERNPVEFDNSPGFFRMLMLAVVLAEDYHVQYDPLRRAGPASSRMGDGFFSDPDRVFLHGLLGPKRQGTCSSLPVLYVAVGRHLGYPLKLVTTKGHLFVRWEGAGERFNIEATGHGLSRFGDDYYRHWPFELTAEEEKTEGYLKSLSPAEELAVFLSIRGMCLCEQDRTSEAAESFRAAVRLAPGCSGYQKMLASLESSLRTKHLLKTETKHQRNNMD